MATSSGRAVSLEHPPVAGKAEAIARRLTLVKGRVQKFEGYVYRQTSILKRWKKMLLGIDPGE